MEQMIKNMESTARQMYLQTGKDGNAVKTLSNTYESLLSQYRRAYYNNKIMPVSEYKSINKQLEELKSIKTKIEIKISSSLFSKEFKEANSYTTALEKVFRSIEKVEEMINGVAKSIENEIVIDPSVQSLLDASIESNIIIFLTNENLRGKGKTAALIKKAHELNTIVIVGLDDHKKYANSLANAMGINEIAITPRDLALPQHRRKVEEKGFLVDETASGDKVTNLISKGYKLLGGFGWILL